jgi:hypothetical protein
MSDENLAQDADQNQGPDPTQSTPQDGEGTGKLSYEELERIAAKERKDGSRANREAQAAKKRIAELEAVLEKQKEAELSELQLAQKKLAEAKEALEKKDREVAHVTRLSAATAFGAQQKYANFVADLLADAQKADPESDVENLLNGIKESHSELFNQPKSTTPGAGEGGPSGGSGSHKAEQLASMEKQLNKLKSTPRGDRRKEMKIANLAGQISRLKKELSS